MSIEILFAILEYSEMTAMRKSSKFGLTAVDGTRWEELIHQLTGGVLRAVRFTLIYPSWPLVD